jgi:hypothetical protein
MEQSESAGALRIFLVVEAVDVFEVSIEGEEEFCEVMSVILVDSM